MRFKLLVLGLSLCLTIGISKIIAQTCGITYGVNDGLFDDCTGDYGPGCINPQLCETDFCYPNNEKCGAHSPAAYSYCVRLYFYCDFPGCRNIHCA